MNSSQRVGTGGRHSWTSRPASAATRRTAAVLPHPDGPTTRTTRGAPGRSHARSHSRRASSFFFATTMSASVLCRGGRREIRVGVGVVEGGREGRARAFRYRDETSPGECRAPRLVFGRPEFRVGREDRGSGFDAPRARRTRVVVPRHGRFGVWLGAFRRRRFREQRHQVRAPRCRRRRPLSRTPSRGGGFPRRSHRARDRANSRPRPAPPRVGCRWRWLG